MAQVAVAEMEDHDADFGTQPRCPLTPQSFDGAIARRRGLGSLRQHVIALFAESHEGHARIIEAA
jgi:hypothetical protein